MKFEFYLKPNAALWRGNITSGPYDGVWVLEQPADYAMLTSALGANRYRHLLRLMGILHQ